MNADVLDAKLRKIKRVLAKAEHPSCPPHEAEAFLAKAAELLAKYGIDAARLADATPGADKVIDRTIPIPRPYMLEKATLLLAVTRPLRCRGVYFTRCPPPDYDKRIVVQLFGYAADLDRVELLYTSLLVQASHALAVTEVPFYDSKAAFRRTWYLGYAGTIRARLTRIEAASVRAATAERSETERPGADSLDHAVCPALGDYASTADPGIFTERGYDAHPTGVADLFGRRLVVVHESDHGRHLAEGTVKRLTGGDRIKARRMREDFWEFAPSHTALMLTNHRPLVRGTDEGIWRRLRLVPFDVVIPAAERDHDLGERLRLELDGVLAWLVAGYTDWRAHGLAEPAQVTGATAGWRDESDALATFLEGCLLGARYSAPSAQLYAAWCAWCDHEGEAPGTQKAFSTALQQRGFDNRRTRTGATWHGIGLPTRADPDDRAGDWRQSQMSDA